MKDPAISPQTTGGASKKRRISKIWLWIALAVILVFIAAIRIRLLQTPLERDEGEFAYMGQLMLKGIPPYLMAYNMKLPGIYAVYALVMAVFGQTIAGIHLGLLLANEIAILLLFLLSRRLFDNLTAFVAAAGYGLLSFSPSVMGTSAHATQFIVPLVLAGTLLLLKAIESGRHGLLFAGGLFFGLAFLMKQHAVFFIAFAAAYYAWEAIQLRPLNLKRIAGGTALILTAAAIPFAITCALIYATGGFAKFWFWTFSYGSQYVTELSWSEAVHNFTNLAWRQIQHWPFVWAMAGIGLTAIFWNKTARSRRPFIIGLALFSLLSICPGFYFRHHYFVTIVPAVSLLAGIATSALTQLLSGPKMMRVIRILPALFMIAFLIHPIVRQDFFFFKATPAQACQMLYGLSPFPASIGVAEYIRNHTTVDDTIAVYGSEPQICFYADRKSASGFIYVYALMEPQIYARKMQLEMIREIEAARPKYAVIVNVYTSWVYRSNSDMTIRRWGDTYFAQNYRVAGLVDILPDGQIQAHWDDEARRIQPQSQSNVFVLERIRQ
jgi:hypothetical protein